MFKQVKQLQDHVVIAYVDKSTNNYTVIRKKHYHKLYNAIISSKRNFKLSNESSLLKIGISIVFINYLKFYKLVSN